MAKHSIALIPGDGIGVEVAQEAVKILRSLEDEAVFFEIQNFDWGSERYFKQGAMMPEDGVELLRPFDTVLFGAVGHPDIQDHITLNGLLLPIRRAFKQYACVRPTELFPGVVCPLKGREAGSIDIVTVRENTEGEYANVGGFAHTGFENEVAIQSNVFTRLGIERVIKFAFELARQRRRRHLTSITKSNAQGYSMVLWDNIFREVANDYQDIETDSLLIDAACMEFVRNPSRFDVIVCSNLFGDIVTDLAAAVTGSIGLAPSGNINPEKTAPSMFEPTHGSAHDIVGQGLANPLGSILCVAMMLDQLGETKAATTVRKAVRTVLEAGLVTPDLHGKLSTTEVGDAVLKAMN